MAKTWDTKMQERFDRLEQKVDHFAGRFDHIDERFDKLEGRVEIVEKKVDVLDRKVDVLDQKVGLLDQRVGSLETKVESLSMKSDMQFEKLQGDIQMLGEGYEEGLKGISRQIGDLARTWDAKWSTHDLALTDHGKRIMVLERRRP